MVPKHKQLRRLLAKALLICMMVGILPVSAEADSGVWDGTSTDTAWYTEHTGDSSYTITTAAQLAGLATLVNAGNSFIDKTITLGDDIVLNDTSGAADWDDSTEGLNPWTAIGTYDNRFAGAFNGGGHTVSGIYISRPDDNFQGLFGCVDSGGTIENVGVTDSYIEGSYYVGGVAGYNHGSTAQNCYNTGNVTGSRLVGGVSGLDYGMIHNCYNTGCVSAGSSVGGVAGNSAGTNGTVKDCYNTGSVTGTYNVGGVAGSTACTIENCHNTGSVTGTMWVGGVFGVNNGGTVDNCCNEGSITGTSIVGGVFGINKGGTGTVDNCCNEGSITGSDHVGGVAGGNGSGTIRNCYNTGTVEGSSEYIGGVVSWNSGNGAVENSYNIGSVTGKSRVGGVIGSNADMSSTENCYNTGGVTGKSRVGGVAGENSASVSGCYYDEEISGVSVGIGYGDTAGTEGKTTDQMQTATPFDGWSTIVWIFAAHVYPQLKSADAQAVAAAKEALTDGAVDVSYGATQADKTAAVQSYVDGLLNKSADVAGVTATVTYNSETGKYDVALFKGSETDSKSMTMIVNEAPDPDIETVNDARAAAESASYNDITQTEAADEAAAEAIVKAVAEAAVDNDTVTVTITDGNYTAPSAGTSADPGGTDGSYRFRVTVSKGSQSATTGTKTVAITATAYTGVTDVQAVAAAKAVLADGTVDVTYGATQADKTAAVQSYVDGLLSNTADAAGVTAAVAYNSGTGTYDVALSKGSETDSKSLNMTVNEVLDPDIETVNDARAAAESASYSDITQTEAADEAEVEAIVKAVAVVAVDNDTVTVTITEGNYIAPEAGTSADPDGTNGSYSFAITVSKGSQSATTGTKTVAITATAYTGVTDVQAVAAAKDALTDGTVDVSYGATQSDKTSAVQSYVDGLLSNTAYAIGVTATVTYNSGTGTYDVALSKGSETDSKSLSMTVNESDDPDITTVATAKTAAESASYSHLKQAKAANEAAAEAAVKAVAEAAVDNDTVKVTINKVSYTAPKAGTSAKPNGKNGSYSFTVTVSKGSQSATTGAKTIVIKAKDFTGVTDVQAVAAAKDALTDGTVDVSYDATQADKTSAVQSYVDAILDDVSDAVGVTAAVTCNSGTGKYDVALSKGRVRDSKSLNMIINEAQRTMLTYSMISHIAAQTYTGNALEPAVTVINGGIALAYGIDYTVSYSNNLNAGAATVTIIGKGDYDGSVSKTFTINKADTTVIELPLASDILVVGKLSDSLLTGGNGSVDGTFSWTDPNTVVIETGTYSVTFTPANANYNSCTCSVPVTVNVQASDNETGVVYDFSNTDLPDDVTSISLMVNLFAQEREGNAANAIVGGLLDAYFPLSNDTRMVLYELSLKDQEGNIIDDFTGTITVKIPIPDGMSGDLYVYWYDEDNGTLVDMNATQHDGYLIFSTSHFSIYTIAAPSDSPAIVSTVDSSAEPKTGSNTVIIIVLALLGAALCFLIIIIVLRKKRANV